MKMLQRTLLFFILNIVTTGLVAQHAVNDDEDYLSDEEHKEFMRPFLSSDSVTIDVAKMVLDSSI